MNDEQILALKELGNFKLNYINSQLRKISLLETAYYVLSTEMPRQHSKAAAPLANAPAAPAIEAVVGRVPELMHPGGHA